MRRLKDPREQCDISPNYADENFTVVSRSLQFIIVLITRQKERKCRINSLMLRTFKSEGWSQKAARRQRPELCTCIWDPFSPKLLNPDTLQLDTLWICSCWGKCDCVLKTILDSLVKCIWNQSFSSQSNEIVRFALQFNVFREVNGKTQNKFSADASVRWQS